MMEKVFEDFCSHVEKLARHVAKEEARNAIEELQLDRALRKELVDGKKAASHIGVSPQTLVRRRNEGLVTGYRIGGRVVYDLDELEEALQSTRKKKKSGRNE